VKRLYESNKESLLARYGSQLIINQLKQDEVSEKPSLAAKWVPREKSKYAQLFTELAVQYFSEYIDTAKTTKAYQKAVIKAKMDFRKLISNLNKKLDTVQIKQCGNDWESIEPSKQTSITMHKQKKAFLNLKKDGTQRSTLSDRIVCAEHFKQYAEKAATGEIQVKGKRIGLNDFTAEAITLLIHNPSLNEEQILNAQWIDNSTQTGSLGKMIAMVDVSGSMQGDPMNAAIALGIRIAEKSLLGKRVLTFSANPTWVNLDSETTFTSMVQKVIRAEWGMNTNFDAALKMILDAIILSKLEPEQVEDMVLTILSDMQIDESDSTFCKNKSLYSRIETMYSEAGIRLWGKPFKPPHILFWNLRSTSGFPTLSNQQNTSMMSGFSPALLNLFCENGITALQSCSPWSIFVESLGNERYKVLDEYITKNL
jgi:hypothetical protein